MSPHALNNEIKFYLSVIETQVWRKIASVTWLEMNMSSKQALHELE